MNAKGKGDSLIKKLVLHPGTGEVPYPDGTKVRFHVKSETLLSDALPSLPSLVPLDYIPVHDGQIIDDSHQWTQPVELLLGKKFKLEVWEEIVSTMRQGEVAIFFIDKKLLSGYPVVSQTLRKAFTKKDAAAPKQPESENKHRCCGLGIKEGLGHKDLDALVSDPRHMKFTIELLSVEAPGSYEKQYWEMSEDERLSSVPLLQRAGNELYKQGKHREAADKYREAIGRLENLMLREKPNDVEWLALNTQKIPLLLNYSQCQLLLEEYYSTVEHCSTVLQHQPDNVKALFRRGRAYAALCDGDAARTDLHLCRQLDATTTSACTRLLSDLALRERQLEERDRKVYAGLFRSDREEETEKGEEVDGKTIEGSEGVEARESKDE